MNFPIAVLVMVFVAISFRQVGRLRLRIWQAMGAGALAVLLSGDISPTDALRAIDSDVMLFLFGMFVVGEALVESGYLYTLAYHAFAGPEAPTRWCLRCCSGGSCLGPPHERHPRHRGHPADAPACARAPLDARLLLLTLAFSVTTAA